MGDSDKNASDNIKVSGGAGTGKSASLAGKEEEPRVLSSVIEEAPGEHLELEEKKELGEIVKPVPVKPSIPKEVEQAGVKHAIPPAPAVKKTKKKILLPLTDDEIVKGLHAHVWQSIRWLAVWCVRQMKKMHIVLKLKVKS